MAFWRISWNGRRPGGPGINRMCAARNSLTAGPPQNLRCSQCGAPVPETEARAPRNIFTHAGFHCAGCRHRRSLRIARRLSAAWALIALGGIILAAGHWHVRAGWMLIHAAALPMVIAVTTAIHETGHALGARIAGFKLSSIEIGTGGLLAEFSVAGLPVVIRQFPIRGVCRIEPGAGEKCPAWRIVLYVGAGPLANLLTAAAIHFGGGHGAGHMAFFLGAALWTSLILGLGSLLPYTDTVAGQPQPSDGLILLRLVTGKVSNTDR